MFSFYGLPGWCRSVLGLLVSLFYPIVRVGVFLPVSDEFF